MGQSRPASGLTRRKRAKAKVQRLDRVTLSVGLCSDAARNTPRSARHWEKLRDMRVLTLSLTYTSKTIYITVLPKLCADPQIYNKLTMASSFPPPPVNTIGIKLSTATTHWTMLTYYQTGTMSASRSERVCKSYLRQNA